MKKNTNGQKTKIRILDAAHSLFNEKGFDVVCVGEIAKRAEITKTMVYYHFDSKEAVMLELVNRLLESIKAEISSKFVDGYHQETMYNHIDDMIDLWKKNKEIGIFIITKGLKDDTVFPKLLEIAKSFYNQLIDNKDESKGLRHHDDAHLEKYFKLLIFNTLPMISLSVVSENVANEFRLSEERLKVIFRNEFIDIFNSILQN